MSDPAPRRDLAAAERRVAQGAVRVERQAALVEEMRCRGPVPPAADALLAALRATLAVWQRQRDTFAGRRDR